MSLVCVAGMHLVPYRIASRTDQQSEHDLRIGVLPVLGPAVDADIVLAGLEVHRGRVIEDHGHRAAEDPPGLVVCHLLHVMLDIVDSLVASAGPPAQLVQEAVYLVLVVELVHEVGHITERLQLAPGAVQARDHQALEQFVVRGPDRTEAYPVEEAAVDEVRPRQAELVLADASEDCIILGCALGCKKLLAVLVLVRPLAGFPFKGYQGGLFLAASKRLLDAVLSAVLGDDLDRAAPALVMLPSDKHASKIAIRRGTPKSRMQSASQIAIWQV